MCVRSAKEIADIFVTPFASGAIPAAGSLRSFALGSAFVHRDNAYVSSNPSPARIGFIAVCFNRTSIPCSPNECLAIRFQQFR